MGGERQRFSRRNTAAERAARPARLVPPPVAIASAQQLLEEYTFLEAAGIAAPVLEQLCAEGAERGILPHMLLIHRGMLTALEYIQLLDASLKGRGGRAPGGVTEIIDALPLTPASVAAAVEAARARGNAALLLLPQQMDWSEPPETRRWRAERAASGLLRSRPELSAGSRFSTWQLMAIPVLPGLTFGGLIVAPQITLLALAGILSLPFVFIVALRLLSLLVVLRLPRPRPLSPQPDASLPIYSVMVPLFREADVVPDLVEAMCRLDYPAAKLDILLIVESVDHETQSALRALDLPPHVRVLVVPDVQPRTKPKALNYALRLARGAYVVIYDAEDDPEPDQLRRAVRTFAEGPANLMCVQGRLALYNHRPGWIARQFMLEYTALFDALLPALVWMRLPIPLGGTSNHFPKAALEQLGGWDAYNVTEDADLGIRIARVGGAVAVLESTTNEEAPERFSVWLPQRTRWMKGFMQTWLVHMRHPVRLLRELGPVGFIGFNAFLGGIVLSSLIHPIFVGILVWEAALGQLLQVPETPFGWVLLSFAAFNLVGGYLSGMALAGLAAKRRGLIWLLPHVLLMPIYWLMISFAAYRAALQLVTNPYLWEKTPHSSRGARARHGAAR